MVPPPPLPTAPVRHAERQLQRLGLARECAQLGARLRTIEIVSGLHQRQILRLLHADHCVPPRGRSPETPEWYHGATLLDRTGASVSARSRSKGATRAGSRSVCALGKVTFPAKLT